MKANANTWMAIISIMCAISGFTLWPYFKGSGWCFASKMDALAFFFLALSAFLVQPQSWVYQLTVAATTIRLCDEFLFDPFVNEWKEYVLFGLLGVVIAIYNIGYHATKNEADEC